MRTPLDTYVLELILMDTISVAGQRCIPGAERTIQRFIPEALYERIIERYDELSDDLDDRDPCFLDRWLRLAAQKDAHWKRKMIKRFICIMRAGGSIGALELAQVASLAAAMDACRECRQLFGVAFRTAPSLWSRS